MASRRRFTSHTAVLDHTITLPLWHPAVTKGVTMFRARRTKVSRVDRVLIAGENNRKIGSHVMKGAWKGFPIFTLTLEERATCPRDCAQFRVCYGNSMNWPKRLVHGLDLEERIQSELADLQEKFPEGFVIRLHVLGDFYSVAYVRKWERWLKRFSALHVFGYTAWKTTTEIGAAIARLRSANWDRFAVRTSGQGLKRFGSGVLDYMPDKPTVNGAIVCPVETNKAASCGDCGLCWNSKRSIVFVLH